MGRINKMKYVVSGFILGGLFFGSLSFADTSSIEISIKPVKFIIDKVDKSLSDSVYNNNGSNVPSSLLYKNTIYVPIRMMGDMFGKPVVWDSGKNLVLVGKSVADGDYLTSLTPVKLAKNTSINTPINVGGQTYENSLSMQVVDPSTIIGVYNSTQSYNLDKRYKTLSFGYGTTNRSYAGSSAKITLLGDEMEIWSDTVVRGVPVHSTSISIEGIQKLDIVVEGLSMFSEVAILNPLLQ